MELGDIVGSIRRHVRVAIAILLLSVAVVAIFVVTRNTVRGDNRYRATVQVLIPARSVEDGTRPEDVPPVLLQGQESLALAPPTVDPAKKAAKLTEKEVDDVKFRVKLNETKDIVNLSADASKTDVARRASEALARSFIVQRGAVAGQRTRIGQGISRRNLDLLSDRLAEVEKELTAAGFKPPPVVTDASSSADPTTTADPTSSDGALPVLDLPEDLPVATILLAYERNTLLNQINREQATYAELGVQALTAKAFAEIVERPAPSQITPPVPSPLTPAAVILGLGALLALVVPTLIDRLDHSIKDSKHAALAFSAPVLSAIPSSSRADQASLATPGSERDRAFRALAATCVATDRLPRAIMVTSPVGNIQDTVAANFAAALASMGMRVALVATNAAQSWFVPSTDTPGAQAITLPELLERAHAGRLNGEIPHRLASTDMANLLVVPSGAGDVKMSLDGLPPLIEALSGDTIDITVIAGPALLEDPNATIFAWATRCVLWAVETGEVEEAEAQEAASRLVLAGVTPFGVAMVGREI